MSERNAEAVDDQQNQAGEIDEQCKCLHQFLRNRCTPYGDEIKEHLSQTSNALSRYGHMYLKRAQITKEAEQRLNFINSAVLLCAAKSRYELTTSDEVELQRTLKTIDELYNVIFDKIGKPRSEAAGLRETSEVVKKRFKQLRERQQTEISKIPPIKEDATKKQLLRLQKEKIEIVKRLLEKNTKDYTVLMYYIAGKCKSILGDPPCEFAIAGLGSLARKEVTLHSAFKYIIILDDDINKANIELNTMEYFRWFSLLFNVIVTGLGETPITSLKLDDFEDWFRDMYTPSGVCIDGIMPWIFKDCGECVDASELILSVADFVIYLFSLRDNDDELKLKNLLRQHCFVYGSECVYNQYVKVVCKALSSKECIAKEVPVLVSDNTKQLLEATPFAGIGFSQFNKDSFFYKPISSCLAYIGVFFKWSCFSSFEIIASLKNFTSDLAVVCGRSQTCHLIELALAVSCELRMKAYAVGYGSRLAVVAGSVSKFIDRQSIYICMQQAWILTRYLDSIRIYADRRKMPDIKICRLFAVWEARGENILREQIDNLEKNRGLSKHDKSIILLNCIHFAGYKRRKCGFDRSANNVALENVKRLILRHPGYIENITVTYALIDIYLDQSKPTEVLKLCEDYFRLRPDKTPPYNALFIRQIQVTVLEQTHSASEVFNYCENALRQNDDVASQLAFKAIRILSQIRNDTVAVETVRNDLKDLTRLACTEGCKTNSLRSILRYIEEIFYLQYENKWIEDAVQTFNLAYIMADSKIQIISMDEIPRFIGYPGADCFVQMASQATEGYKIRQMARKVFDITTRIEFREDIQSLFVDAMRLILHEQLKHPSIHNIALMESCLYVIPFTMKSMPTVEEVRKYLGVFDKTRDAVKKFLDSRATEETSENPKTATIEKSRNSKKALDVATIGAIEQCANLRDITGSAAAGSSGNSIKVQDVPGTSAGASGVNVAKRTDPPVTAAGKSTRTRVKVTEMTITIAGESIENPDEVYPSISLGEQEILNLKEILQEILTFRSTENDKQ